MQERDNKNRKAAALRYSEDDDVPVITASGCGSIAEKIQKIAAENSIPVIRDVIMANMLVKEKNGQIPENCSLR